MLPPSPLPALSCPYRHAVRRDEEGREIASCQLAGEVTGVSDPEILRVSRGLCELCVKRLPVPEPASPNPVAASMICVACERVIKRDGVPQLDVAAARKLMAWAAQHLDLAGGRAEMRPVHHGRRDPCLYLGAQTGERPCLTCRGSVRQKVFACSHEAHSDTTILDCSKCPDHEARLSGGTVHSWAVGVTAAPRAKPTLEPSLRSLATAGWRDAIVFAEPGTPIPDWLERHRLVQRPVTLGAWPNWLLSLQELTLRYPWADAYLLCQDDVLYTRDLRTYLEHSLWPMEKVGVVSLHTALHQERGNRGFSALEKNEVMAWGAQAYVFPNAAARSLLRSAIATNHRNRGPRSGLCNIDTVVGQWCDLSGLPYLVHSPSPTQHIGDASAIWERGDTIGRRRSATFPGETHSICEIMDVPIPEAAPGPGNPPQDPWEGTLAICTPCAGRFEALEPWREWLMHAELPARTRLYLLDTGGDEAFSARLRSAAEEFADSDRFENVHLHLRRKAAEILARQDPRRSWNVAEAYNAALRNAARDEDFVFLLEDDTIPPMNCLPALYRARSELILRGEKPGLVGAGYESAVSRGRYCASFARTGWGSPIPLGSLTTDEIVEVGVMGVGSALFDGTLFWNCLPVRGESMGGVMGPDSYLCAEVRRKGYTIWLHGGLLCDHLAAKD